MLVNTVGPGIRLLDLVPPRSALCPKAGFLTSLDLSFLTYTMGIILLTSESCWEDQNNSYKAVKMVFGI